MYYPQYMQQQPQQSITWVQGEAGAKSYLIGAGQSVLLMDSEDSIFYIKSADQSGMPTLRRFRFEEIVDEPRQVVEPPSTSQFITREEFEKAIAELSKPKQRNNNNNRRDSRNGKSDL